MTTRRPRSSLPLLALLPCAVAVLCSSVAHAHGVLIKGEDIRPTPWGETCFPIGNLVWPLFWGFLLIKWSAIRLAVRPRRPLILFATVLTLHAIAYPAAMAASWHIGAWATFLAAAFKLTALLGFRAYGNRHGWFTRSGPWPGWAIAVVLAHIAAIAVGREALEIPGRPMHRSAWFTCPSCSGLWNVKEALNAYLVDQSALPPDLRALTTPVAYIFAIPDDLGAPGEPYAYYPHETGDPATRAYLLVGVGPDGDSDFSPRDARRALAGLTSTTLIQPCQFDPTNGATSSGDVIWRRRPGEGRDRWSPMRYRKKDGRE